MSRSFRLSLAIRFALAMALGLIALSALTFFAIRAALDRQIDASLLAVASIQAASVTDAPSGEMHFHEWELTPAEAAQVRDLNRFSQVWSENGESLLRTRYITADLPLDTTALRDAMRGSVVWVEDAFQGIPVRSLYYPLGRLGMAHEPHVLQVAGPLEARNRLLRQSLLLMLALVVLITGATMAGAWWLADRAVSPVREIIAQAEEIGATTLGRRIDAHADSREYQRLVQVLNTMLARIDTAFDAQRRFTADASHELRSPLTVLRGELELARRRPRKPEEYERVIDSSLEEVERLARVADDLLTLARSDAGVLAPRPDAVDLLDRARDVADRLGSSAAQRQLRLTVTGTGSTLATVDADLINRLIWNLIANAIAFTPVGGDVSIDVSRRAGAPVLRVSDTGPGIPEAALPRVFERFFQVDEARSRNTGAHGTGLGLAIVRAIADVHGATVHARNRAGGGAEFEVRFRREEDRPAT